MLGFKRLARKLARQVPRPLGFLLLCSSSKVTLSLHEPRQQVHLAQDQDTGLCAIWDPSSLGGSQGQICPVTGKSRLVG